jgi:hypothetical protein
MGGVWDSSVSSGFNFVTSLMFTRPFVTWHSFTVGTYLLSTIGISFGLVLCFALMGYITGTLINNSYIGFLVLVLLNFATVGVADQIFGANMPLFVISLSPIWLAFQRNMWFTDGGSSILWAHFETVGVMGSLAVLAVLCVLAWRLFKIKNLT